jgi:hypothetical protein
MNTIALTILLPENRVAVLHLPFPVTLEDLSAAREHVELWARIRFPETKDPDPDPTTYPER